MKLRQPAENIIENDNQDSTEVTVRDYTTTHFTCVVVNLPRQQKNTAKRVVGMEDLVPFTRYDLQTRKSLTMNLQTAKHIN